MRLKSTWLFDYRQQRHLAAYVRLIQRSTPSPGSLPCPIQQTDTMKHARHAQPIRIETIASTVIRIHRENSGLEQRIEDVTPRSALQTLAASIGLRAHVRRTV